MSSYAVSPSLSDDKSDERDVDMESDVSLFQIHKTYFYCYSISGLFTGGQLSELCPRLRTVLSAGYTGKISSIYEQ